MGKVVIPSGFRRILRDQRKRWVHKEPVGFVRFGNLRRIQPISRTFGFDRGLCIDRYYIEKFLASQSKYIQGHVLEIGGDTYTRKFGDERVMGSDVLDTKEGNSQATIVADLTSADHIQSNTFDCIICTQTLQFIYDMRGAVQTLFRILKPDGVLLATFSGISQISRYDMDRWGEYWRVTTLSARRMLCELFPPENITVDAYGNVLAAIAFLHGLAAEELRPDELNYRDPDYEVLIAVRALKNAEVG